MIPRFKPFLGTAEMASLLCPPAPDAVVLFEGEFAHLFEAKHALAFPYGRSALWAFFKAMGIEGIEVIMPAYTCSVVAHAVFLSGNIPRFVDITLHDYNMNLDEVETTINERTGAVIATHLFGYPLDVERLFEIVREAEKRYEHKIWIIQDCAHSFGARWHGRLVCNVGDVALFGTGISKTITSIFGGMLTLDDSRVAARLRDWREAHFVRSGPGKTLKRTIYLIQTRLAFSRLFYGLINWVEENTTLLDGYSKAFHKDGKIRFPPDSSDQMSSLEAAIGRIQLRKYEQIVVHRQAVVRQYDEQLPKVVGWAYPPIIAGATYSHYVIRVPDRQGVIRAAARNGIQLGQLIEYSIPHMDCYREFVAGKEFPNSLLCSCHTINLPVHMYVNENVVRAICNVFKHMEI